METVEVGSLGALINEVLGSDYDRASWFRGQGCDSHQLLPSLVRRMNSAAGSAEVPFSNVLETENRLLTRFKQRSLPYWTTDSMRPDAAWEYLFAMQHYGVPTRLLDWTTNLLVAVYFSLQHDRKRCTCGNECKPTVFVLRPLLLNSRNPRLEAHPEGIFATSDEELKSWAPGTNGITVPPWPVSLHGTHNTSRILAQQGNFTVMGSKVAALEDSPAVTNNDGQQTLIRYCLAGDPRQALADLSKIGISQATVFPDLEGVSRTIASEELD